MRQLFTELTLKDSEVLRKKKAIGTTNYEFTAEEVETARRHLQTLYPNCRVQTRFATTILLLNELYRLAK